MGDGNDDPGGSSPRRSQYRDVLMQVENEVLMEGIWESVGLESDDSDSDSELPEGLNSVPHLVLSKEECKVLRKPWRRALIVKLVGKSVPFNILVEHLQSCWRIQGEFDVIDIGNGYFVVKLASLKDHS